MLNSIQIHLAGASGFVIKEEEKELISGGNDFMMKVFDVESLEMKREINIEEEAHCIEIKNNDIYWGGESEKVFKV
jgi:hypothetical protein